MAPGSSGNLSRPLSGPRLPPSTATETTQSLPGLNSARPILTKLLLADWGFANNLDFLFRQNLSKDNDKRAVFTNTRKTCTHWGATSGKNEPNKMQYCDHHDAKSVIFCESPVVVGASLPSVNLGVYIPIFSHSTTYLERWYFECWYFEPLPIFYSFFNSLFQCQEH